MGGSEEEGRIGVVGARGFEPPTSASRTLRANRTALRPASVIIGGFNLNCKPGVNYQGKFERLNPFKNQDSPSPCQGEGDKGDRVNKKEILHCDN